MARRKRSSTGRAVAAVGAGAFLVWLLWRGRSGWHASHNGGGNGGSDGAIEPVAIWLRYDDSIEIDGVESDLTTTLERAREVGRASVRATGAARTGWVGTVINALQDAGVDVGASEDLWPAAWAERAYQEARRRSDGSQGGNT